MSITRVNQQKIEVYVSMIDDLLQILDRLENCGSGTTSDTNTDTGIIIGKIGFADMNVEIGMEYFLYINLFGPPKEGIFDPSLLNKARRQMCIDDGQVTDNWPCNRCSTPVCNTCGLCSASCCDFCKCSRCAGATGATGATFKSLCGKHGCVCPGCATGPSGATGPCSICNDTIYPLGWTGSTQWTLLSDIPGATGACSHGATGATGATGTHSYNDIDTSAHGPCCRSCGPRQPSGCGRCSCHSRISVASYVMALPVYVDPNGNTVIMQGGGNNFISGGGGNFISGGGGNFISGGINNTTSNNTTNNTTINNTSASAFSIASANAVPVVTGASGREMDSDILGNLAKLGVPLN